MPDEGRAAALPLDGAACLQMYWQRRELIGNAPLSGRLSASGSSQTAQRAPHKFLVLVLAMPMRNLVALCVTTKTRHLDRLGQLGEFEQDSNTDSEQERNTDSQSARNKAQAAQQAMAQA